MNISNKIANWNEVLLQADKKIKEVVDQATGQFYYEVAEYKNDNSMACKAINYIKEKTGKDLRFSFLNIDKVIFTTKHEANLEDFIKDYRFDINTENFAYTKVTVKEFDAIKRSNALDKVMARELPVDMPSIEIGGKSADKSRLIDFEKMAEAAYTRSPDHKSQGMVTQNEGVQHDSFSSMLEQLSSGTPSVSDQEMVKDFARGKTNLGTEYVFGKSQTGFVGSKSSDELINAVREFYKNGADKNEAQSNSVEKSKPEPKVDLDDFAKELVAEFSKPEHKNTVKIVKSKDLGRGR